MMKQALVGGLFFLMVGCCAGQRLPDSSRQLLNRYDLVLSHLDLDTLQGKIEAIPNSIGIYGMPDAEPAVNKIFIAADKKAVARLVGLEDNLPDSILSPFDLIALHELGHFFLHTYEHTDTRKKWADEFLASYFALCYLKQINDSLGLPQVDDTGWQPKYKSLSSFEQLYEDVGPTNYAWYQGRFQKLATALYPKFKVGLLKLFIENFSINEKKTDPLVLLRQLAPETTNQWLAEMKD
jgi:hypothetical protein